MFSPTSVTWAILKDQRPLRGCHCVQTLVVFVRQFGTGSYDRQLSSVCINQHVLSLLSLCLVSSHMGKHTAGLDHKWWTVERKNGKNLQHIDFHDRIIGSFATHTMRNITATNDCRVHYRMALRPCHLQATLNGHQVYQCYHGRTHCANQRNANVQLPVCNFLLHSKFVCCIDK